VTDLPRGTVTLLFTDIEGSTQLQHRLGERYQDVVKEHRRVLEAAFDEHGGVVVDRQTESFFVVFTRARHAAQAAADAQQALAEQEWPDGVQVQVRMGIHSGDPELDGDRYVGLAVSRAARVCAAAHGGQVLLSSSARALLSDHDRTALRSLGSYRLKDFAEPEPISQLSVDGLPSQFPRIRTAAVPPRRTRLLLVGAGLLLAAIAALAIVIFTNGGGSIVVSPTSLAVIDPDSNELTDAIDLGFKSNLIASGEGHVWVVDPTGTTLRKIDPQERRVAIFPLGVGAGDVPFGVAVGMGAVWVAVHRGTRHIVLELRPEVGEVRNEIPYGEETTAPAFSRMQPLAVGGGFVWALDAAGGSLWRIDPRAERERKLAEGLGGLSLAVGRDAVWVAGSARLTKIDPATGLVLNSEPVGSEAFSESASVALGADAVWFAASSRPTLSKVDPETIATSETFTVGRGPSGVAIGEGAVWVANSGDGTVSRVDLEDGKRETVEVGAVPGGIVTAFGDVWTSPGEPQG
jgi:class 3 adenylate cyclase/DNA-binding beta-propeller fold protein YncE